MNTISLINLHTMQVDQMPPEAHPMLALGNFDGVHIAHRHLLGVAADIAKQSNILSAVFCFDPPSSRYLSPAFAGALSTREEKLACFAECGMDYAYLADFESLRSWSADQFITTALQQLCRASTVVCGFNFHFGRGGIGNAELLKHHFPPSRVHVIDAMTIEQNGVSVPVSSSLIRTLLTKGDVQTAATLLGVPYRFTAPVLHGKQLGRTLGVPTLNQQFPSEKLIPAKGIYATRVLVDGRWLPGVTNLGTRPTVDGTSAEAIYCETHVLDTTLDLYDRPVTVAFYERLRDEQAFASLTDLQHAILKDIEKTKQLFSLLS